MNSFESELMATQKERGLFNNASYSKTFYITNLIKLQMAKVRKVMLTNVSTLKKEAKIEEAARLLVRTENGCIVVVENNLPIGIVTELDFVRHVPSSGKTLKEPVSKIMSSPVTFMSPDTKLEEALKIIDTKRFRKYPVVENGKLAGLVTKNDIVHYISDNMRLHRGIQNLVLIFFVLFELFIFLIYQPLLKYLGA